MKLPVLADFYLVGGTALALQIGHRKSIDLDLFCDSSHDQEQIVQVLPIPKVEFARTPVFLGVTVNGVKCDFVKFLFPRIEPLLEVEGVRMAKPIEISAMKLWAITQRGSKKDFIDLYFLLKQFSFEEMFEFFRRKFSSIEPFMVLRSFTWFGDAEEDLDPFMLEPITWEEIKDGLVEEIEEYMGKI